jgi:hypothetical protein
MDSISSERSAAATKETTVDVRCTGHVRTAIGTHRLEFTFEGETLREFLKAFFDEYDVEELLIAETGPTRPPGGGRVHPTTFPEPGGRTRKESRRGRTSESA